MKGYIGKQVYDSNGILIGVVDKVWKRWNKNKKSLGVKIHENIRDTMFRGTTKLIPIPEEILQKNTEVITLNKTVDYLSKLWIQTVIHNLASNDEMIEKVVYDKNLSRIGVISSWIESKGELKQYECILDPYICDKYNLSYNILYPIPLEYLNYMRDTIMLNKTFNQLKKLWKHNNKDVKKKTKINKKTSAKTKSYNKSKSKTKIKNKK